MENDIKKNGSGYYDPTAFKAIINTGGVNNMEVYKGDIFYIEKGKTGEKSPAVVVSATEVIEETGCAQVAWLTNKEENSSSTHVKVMCMTPSVAICEKLSFAYLDRFGEYIRTCTEKEIQDIDNAMLATLGIERQNDNADCEEIRTLKKELEEKQREIEEIEFAEQHGANLTTKIATPDLIPPDSDYNVVINNVIYAIIYVDHDKKNRELYFYLEEVRKIERQN